MVTHQLQDAFYIATHEARDQNGHLATVENTSVWMRTAARRLTDRYSRRLQLWGTELAHTRGEVGHGRSLQVQRPSILDRHNRERVGAHCGGHPRVCHD